MRRVLFLGVAALVIAAPTPIAAQPPLRTPSVGSGASPRGTTPGAAAPARDRTRLLPGTRSDAFSTIHGTALDSTNGRLADSIVRLRDARFGGIVDATTTDKAGLFSFRSLDPGSYIIELVGEDQSILGASQILNLNAGDAVSAIVRMPSRVPPFGGVLGRSTPSAALVMSTAAAAGVLAIEVAGEQKSPRR